MKNWKELSVYLTKSRPDVHENGLRGNTTYCINTFYLLKKLLKIIPCIILHLILLFPVSGSENNIKISFFNQEPRENERVVIPHKAAMYSAVLPGLGQIYNRKYWKLPVVYGGFAALTYWTVFNHDNFVRYKTAIELRTDGNPHTVDEFSGDPRFTEQVMRDYMDFYRRNRDRAIIWTAGFYALTIVDALVDAHLQDFDVSEDLSLKIAPSLINRQNMPGGNSNSGISLGIRCSINF